MEEPFALDSYSSSISASNAQNFVSVAANGNGVHIIDVSQVHTVVSHTTGPKSRFTAPPVSKIKGSVFTSYAASGNTLFTWDEDIKSSIAERAKQKKREITLDHSVNGLFLAGDSLVVQSNEGHLSLVDEDDTIKKTVHHSGDVQKTFYFHSPSFYNSPVIVSFTSTSIQIIDASSLELLATIPAPLQKYHLYTCSSSGWISLLSSDGTWSSSQLSSSPFNLYPVPETTLRLSISPQSLLPLNTSHVLLAAHNNSGIVLLLWDLAFSVLLASRTIPSSTAPTSLSLIDATESGHILLVTQSNKSRSSILAIPITVPASSTVANALGKAGAGDAFLLKSEEASSGSASKKKKDKVPLEPKAFFAYVDNREKEGEKLGFNAIRETFLSTQSCEIARWLLDRGLVSSSMFSQDGGLLGVLRSRGDWETITQILSQNQVPDLTENEVIETLAVVIAHHRAISSGESGPMQVDSSSSSPPLPQFLSTLLSSTSWFHSPSSLRIALRSYLPSASSSSGSVSTTSTTTGGAKVTPETLLDTLLPLLTILVSWIRVHLHSSTEDVKVRMPTKKDVVKKDGVYVFQPRASSSKDGVKGDSEKETPASAQTPPLHSILSLLTPLIDISYIHLISLPPSSLKIPSSTPHRLLRLLTDLQETHLPTLLAQIELTEPLRGALEGFGRAQREAEAAATLVDGDDSSEAEVESGDEKGADDDEDTAMKGEKDAAGNKSKTKTKAGKRDKGTREGQSGASNWRQRRKIAHELEGMAVGLYRLEEIVL
ncbi:hypothetical protein VKT23_004649 [Stygiomarasmius scandens]|uniref:Uncharacterized protein n=1 Tax=Marasmiellus scandens TaxID=2682957 RepID=A0ABR1JUU6_9AGAR